MSVNLEQIERNLRRKLLLEHPEAFQEAIANHYTSCAQLVFDLKKLIDNRRWYGSTDATEEAIRFLQQRIEQEHLKSFGAPLLSLPTLNPKEQSK